MLRYEIPTGDKHRYTEGKEVLGCKKSTLLSFFHPARSTHTFLPLTRLTCARWHLGVLSLRDCMKFFRHYAIPPTPKAKFKKPLLMYDYHPSYPDLAVFTFVSYRNSVASRVYQTTLGIWPISWLPCLKKRTRFEQLPVTSSRIMPTSSSRLLQR